MASENLQRGASVDESDAPSKLGRDRNNSSFRKVVGLDITKNHYQPVTKKAVSTNETWNITSGQKAFEDYKHCYPYINDDGHTIMMTEFEFHSRMQKKYRALLGDKYIYPLLGVEHKIDETELIDITREDKDLLKIFVPHEVEVCIPSGVKSVKTNTRKIGYFIISNNGEIFPSGVKTILNKDLRELEERRKKRLEMGDFSAPINNADVTADAIVEKFIVGLEVPNVRRLRDVLGLTESREEVLAKMEALGILDKYKVELDNNQYYEQFVRGRSRKCDFLGDYREFKDDEPFDWSQFESKDADSVTTHDTAENDSVPPLVKPPALDAAFRKISANSFDSGMDVETPPLSPMPPTTNGTQS